MSNLLAAARFVPQLAALEAALREDIAQRFARRCTRSGKTSSSEEESVAAAIPPRRPHSTTPWPSVSRLEELSTAATAAAGAQLEEELGSVCMAAVAAVEEAEAAATKAAAAAAAADAEAIFSGMAAQWWGAQPVAPPQRAPPPEATAHAPPDAPAEAHASPEPSLRGFICNPAAHAATASRRPQGVGSAGAGHAGASGSGQLHGQQLALPAAGSKRPAVWGKWTRQESGWMQEEPNEVEEALLQRINGRRMTVTPLRSSSQQQEFSFFIPSGGAATTDSVTLHQQAKASEHRQSEAVAMQVDSEGGQVAQHARRNTWRAREEAKLSAGQAGGLDGAYWAPK